MNLIQIGKRVILEEAKALQSLADTLDENFEKAVEVIYNTKGKLVVTGMGKSGLIGKKIAATMASTGTPSFFLHPGEAIHGDLGMISKEDTVLAISNSGETPELLAIIPTIKRWGNTVIAITNNPKSTLARESDIHLFLNVEKEACPLNLAPTSSSTATLALGDALAIALLEKRGFTEREFAMFHPGGALGRKLMKVEEIMHTGDRLPLVKEETPLKKAVIVMSEKGFGCALAEEEGALKGIITDGDLRRFVEKGGSIDKSYVKDAMTKNPKAISASSLAVEALELMEKYNITVLPVVDEKGKVQGLVHLHDILKSGVI